MINRHNYEEFFLMYVDNELTTQQRTEVELFMQQNPDLSSEMELLQQAKLLPDDDLLYTGKEELLKSHNNIGADNYEEHFLNYIDDELNEDEKYEVEKFVLQHPQFQDSFTLLKQTKLEVETVVFEDKRSLYRKETTRVIPLFIKISSVAAVLTGVAVLMWMVFPKAGNQPDVAIISTVDQKENAIAQNNDTAKKIQPPVIYKDEQDIATVNNGKSEKEKQAQTAVSKKIKDVVPHLPAQDKAVSEKITIAAFENHENDKPAANIDNTTLSNADNRNNNTGLLANNSNNDKQDDIYAYYNPDIAKSGDNYAKPAVYKELDTDDEENKNTIYVGSLGLNKNKVRGIMKKVGGIFSGKSKNTTQNENGKLQVANFELNTN